MFKKTLAVLAVSLSTVGLASASGIGGVVVIGGVGGGYVGTAAGSAQSVTEGAAVAVGNVTGSGHSIQSSVATGGGTASVAGAVSPSGVSVSTATTQHANVRAIGTTNQAALDRKGLIQNGSIGQAQSMNTASGWANFDTVGFGGIVAIGGIAGFTGFGGNIPQ